MFMAFKIENETQWSKVFGGLIIYLFKLLYLMYIFHFQKLQMFESGISMGIIFT